jgi:hypothetical protein
LQTAYQSTNKGIYGHPGGIVHAALHVAGTAVILVAFGVSIGWTAALLAAEFVIHYHTDWIRKWMTDRYSLSVGPKFWFLFGLDQLIHHATYAAIAFAMFEM